MSSLAFILRSDGSIEDLPPREPTLAEAQAAVGGYIEVVEIIWLGQVAHMVLDEEGKLKGKPINHKATAAARGFIASHDIIVGDVMILTGKARLT